MEQEAIAYRAKYKLRRLATLRSRGNVATTGVVSQPHRKPLKCLGIGLRSPSAQSKLTA